MHYIEFETLGKQFWLLDTYEGLAECLISEEEYRLGILPGGYYPCYEEVIKRFGSIPGLSIIKGVIPDTLAAGEIRSDLYLIDMNNAAPETAAAEFRESNDQ